MNGVSANTDQRSEFTDANSDHDRAFAGRMEEIIADVGGVTKLSRRAELSKSVIEKYRHLQSDPSRRRLSALANAAGVRVEWLAIGAGPKQLSDEPSATARPDVGAPNPFRQELSTRIREVEKRFKNRSEAAKAAGVAKSSFEGWVEGKADPSFEGLSRLAEEVGVSLDWLAHGRTTAVAPVNGGDRAGLTAEVGTTPSATDSIMIPRFNARLSAGPGAFSQRAEVLDYIPFTPQFLRRKLGRGSIEGLVIVEAAGDSMEPTISHGDLIMIDTHDTMPHDGLYALVLDDALLVKRLHKMVGGLEVASDNRDLYHATTLPRDRTDEVTVVGRVRWIGRVV